MAFCEGKPPLQGGFSPQRASNAVSVPCYDVMANPLVPKLHAILWKISRKIFFDKLFKWKYDKLILHSGARCYIGGSANPISK